MAWDRRWETGTRERLGAGGGDLTWRLPGFRWFRLRPNDFRIVKTKVSGFKRYLTTNRGMRLGEER